MACHPGKRNVCRLVRFGGFMRSWLPEVVHIGDLLHTQPAELTGTHSAVHAVTAAVIGLHDVGTAARARFDLLCIFSNRVNVLGVTTPSAIFIQHRGIKWPEKKKKKRTPAQRNKTKEGVTSSGFFIEDVQRGGIGAAWRVAGSLPPGLVTRLVGVPQLPTVVAELRVTSLPAAAQLGTLRTAVSYHRVAEER